MTKSLILTVMTKIINHAVNWSGDVTYSYTTEAGTTSVDGLLTPDGSTVIVGLAVSWCDRDVYYVALTETSTHCKHSLFYRFKKFGLELPYRSIKCPN